MENTKEKRIKRVRSKIFGTNLRPRLAVFRSNKHIYAQLINDEKGETLVCASDKELKNIKTDKIAEEVGKILAKKAVVKKITCAVFDRRAYKYHGQIKKLADGARNGGLKI